MIIWIILIAFGVIFCVGVNIYAYRGREASYAESVKIIEKSKNMTDAQKDETLMCMAKSHRKERHEGWTAWLVPVNLVIIGVIGGIIIHQTNLEKQSTASFYSKYKQSSSTNHYSSKGSSSGSSSSGNSTAVSTSDGKNSMNSGSGYTYTVSPSALKDAVGDYDCAEDFADDWGDSFDNYGDAEDFWDDNY